MIEASHQKTTKTIPPIQATTSAAAPMTTAAATRGQRSPPKRAPGARGAGSLFASWFDAIRALPSRGRHDRRGLRRATKAPLARRVLIQRRYKRRIVEIGPQNGQKNQFRVRGLPQKKVGEPHFPRRPDDEVRVRKVRRVEPRGDLIGVDGACVEPALANVDREPPRRLDDFLSAPVVESHRKRQPAIV